ncbi:hypothetical protein [Streptomyces nanshensis]|uniref:hypothetical protein n=1 Tax=Streptomyces nanshensis TaxID=518642 RepID=UPI00085C72E8|nr:hypothetical protein [Streptomyces nanshensis]
MTAPAVRGSARRPVAVWERKPLSGRMRRLLLEGDVEDRYVGRDEADTGYRQTMALAVGCSQPGREWTPADFHQALIYTPTAGGTWARRLRQRKGTAYAEAKLTDMLFRAREWVARSGTIRGRDEAWEQIERFRRIVEMRPWPTRRGRDTDLKNLVARLELCEWAGGLEHTIAARPLAERMGCAKQTVADSDQRLIEAGFLEQLERGTGANHGSRWRLRLPDDLPEELRSWMCATPGQSPTAGERGAETVLVLHTDTASLAAVMAHDAFHRYAHGTSGARLLACLDAVDGRSAEELRTATGLHRTTVGRKLRAMAADGLVTELEGLYYLAAELAGEVAVHPHEATLQAAATQRGTAGAGQRRRRRHQRERAAFQRWWAERQVRRRAARPRPVLVPAGVVDPSTGEVLDRRWRGWDVSDPARPVWRDDGDVPLPAHAHGAA